MFFNENLKSPTYFKTIYCDHFFCVVFILSFTISLWALFSLQAVALHEDDLYIMGGTSGYHYNLDVHRINLVTKESEELFVSSQGNPHEPPDEPPPR